MDIERAIEFVLAQQAQSDARHAQFKAEFEAPLSQSRTDFEARQQRAEERHDRKMAQIRAQISRGVRLAVEEARRERPQRKEEDAKLAALHAETERSLQQLVASSISPVT